MAMNKWNLLDKKTKEIAGLVKRYQYVLVVLLVGILLMVLPNTKTKETTAEEPVTEENSAESLERRLEALLEQVDGTGKTKVMLTLRKGTGYEYLSDMTTEVRSDGEKKETQMVFASGSGGDSPVLIGTTYPEYQGAVVVCEGGDRPSVRLAVIDAVSSLTGLSASQIAVIKMNSN